MSDELQANDGGEEQDSSPGPLDEIERYRRELKRERLSKKQFAIDELYSLWSETTDLVFRSNLGEDARVEELNYLGRIVHRLAVAADERKRSSAALNMLAGTLNTLMPREWFGDPSQRESVRRQVSDANPEVAALNREFHFGPDAQKAVVSKIPPLDLSPSIKDVLAMHESVAASKQMMDGLLAAEQAKAMAYDYHREITKPPLRIPVHPSAVFPHRQDREPEYEVDERCDVPGLSITIASGIPSGGDPVAEDIERGFDLLRQLSKSLRSRGANLSAGAEDKQLHPMENVLREWLPRPAKAMAPLLHQVLEHIDDLDAVQRILASEHLDDRRKQALASNAESRMREQTSDRGVLGATESALAAWRCLLPRLYDHEGHRAINRSDRRTARAVGTDWSADIAYRPSFVGASLNLAAACERTAALAREKGFDREDYRAAIRLTERLRKNPDWPSLSARDAIKHLDEQIQLAQALDDLLADLEFEAGADAAPAIATPKVAQPVQDARNDVQLIGWKQILPELGLEPTSRKDRDRVKKLNDEFGGPIRKHRRRQVIANHGALMEWWRKLDVRAHEAAERSAAADRQDLVINKDLANPGVRKELGFHDRSHPNRTRRPG